LIEEADKRDSKIKVGIELRKRLEEGI